jgi:hypothetical protein
MGMTPGDLEVLLRVGADSTGAQQSIQDYVAATKLSTQQIAQQYRIQSQAATSAAKQIKTEMSQALGQIDFLAKGLASGANVEWAKKAVPEIEQYKAQVQSLGSQLQTLQGQQQQSVQTFAQSVRSQLSGLAALRYAIRSTLGLASFVYLVSEWHQIVAGIQGAVHWMEGFGEAAQKAMAQLNRYNQQALVQFQGLTTQIKLATGQMLIAQTEQRINADVTQRQTVAARSYWQNLRDEIEGATSAATGNAAALATFLSGFAQKTSAAADEAQQTLLLNKQLAEEGRLEKQLHEEQKKSGDAAERAAEKAERAEGATQRAAERAEAAKQRAAAATARAVARAQAQEQAFLRSSDATLQRFLRHMDEVDAKTARSMMPKPLTGIDRQSLTTMPSGQLAQSQAPVAAAFNTTTPAISKQAQAWLSLKQAMMQSQPMQQSAAQDMTRLAAGTMQAGVAAAIYGQNVGKAMEKATKAVLASVAQQAAVKAVFYFAEGLGDSFWNPYAAGAEFAAAEMFGVIAAGAGAIAAAIPGGGSTRSRGSFGGGYGSSRSHASEGAGGDSAGSGAGPGSGQQTAPGGNMPQPPGSGNLTVAVMGESEAGNWLANTLNVAQQLGAAGLSAQRTTGIPNPTY